MRFTKIICAVAIALIVASSVFSVQAQGKRTATVTAVEGDAQVMASIDKGWQAVSAGMALSEGAIIKTGESSSVVFEIDGQGSLATVELKPFSKLTLAELRKNEETGKLSTLLDLALGEALIKTKNADAKRSTFEVKTPTSIVTVENGTAAFTIKVERLD